MSEFRWLLLAAGLAVLAIVFWWTRRETAGKPVLPPVLRRREPPALTAGEESPPAVAERPQGGEPSAARPRETARILTVRLTGQGNASFPGEALLAALVEAGLRHGRFGIFHRQIDGGGDAVAFSVASLVEPGTFDPASMPANRFPGVSFFLTLPVPGDNVAAFDDMMATARALARRLDGQILDDQGSRLSVQRERFLREEVIQFQHKPGAG